MKLTEVTAYKSKTATILKEGYQDLTETQVIYLNRWEKELWPLVEQYVAEASAQLTPDQIQDIFKGAESVADASGNNKNVLGKAAGAVGAAAKLPVDIAKKVISGIYDGVTTVELDNLAAETAASLTTKHPDFAKLAARVAISNLHKVTSKSFSNTMKRLYTYVDPKTSENAPLLSKETYGVINKNAALLDSSIIYDRDFSYDYFGFKTLERSYLMKIDGKIVERPQHMLMRVAVGIHGEDIDAVIETYNLLSEKWFTHATPTLFNAGTRRQ